MSTGTNELKEPSPDVGGALQVLPARDDVVAARRSELLALFCEPRFYFKTFRPRSLGEKAVLALLTRDQTQLVFRGGELIGLWEISYANYAGMIFKLDFRLSEQVDPIVSASVLDAMMEPFLAHRPVHNVVWSTLELDLEGIATVSHSRWFEHVGELGSYGVRERRKQAMTYFILAPGER
jgi:hypothetical protein